MRLTRQARRQRQDIRGQIERGDLRKTGAQIREGDRPERGPTSPDRHSRDDIRGVARRQGAKPCGRIGDCSHHSHGRGVGPSAIVDFDIDAIVNNWRRRVCSNTLAPVRDDLIEIEEINLVCRGLVTRGRRNIDFDVRRFVMDHLRSGPDGRIVAAVGVFAAPRVEHGVADVEFNVRLRWRIELPFE